MVKPGRLAVQEALRGKCPYCGCDPAACNFSVDHAVPTSRGGGYGWQNLKICCAACNRVKGPLTPQEFKDLRNAMRDWPRSIQKNLLARLRAGSSVARRISFVPDNAHLSLPSGQVILDKIN